LFISSLASAEISIPNGKHFSAEAVRKCLCGLWPDLPGHDVIPPRAARRASAMSRAIVVWRADTSSTRGIAAGVSERQEACQRDDEPLPCAGYGIRNRLL
jgi:hypothetical protein